MLFTGEGRIMSLSSLDHCSIRTVKLRETREFYVNILGMVDGDRADFPFPGARFSTYACRWMFAERVSYALGIAI